MTEPKPFVEPAPQTIPAAEPMVQRPRWRVSVIWILPVVSALIGASLLLRHEITQGPRITVSFQNADGLEANKTQVRYLDVPIGNVEDITLADDKSHVEVSIDLLRSAKSFARSDTRFWVVKPRVGIGGISGIGTLLSGPYIGVDPGTGGHGQTTFTGLEQPPAVTSESHGSAFNLHSSDLGSLDIGSPVYYRRLRVGQVVRYALDADGRGVTIGIFVDAPNDHFVTTSSRFWNASGFDVSLGADGLKLSTQSLASVAAGGVAFLNPQWAPADALPAAPETRFELLKEETTAMERPRGEPVYVVMTFEKSLRGLSINAPVELVGVDIGKVVSVSLDYDPIMHRFPITVGAVLYPERLGHIFNDPRKPEDEQTRVAALMSGLVARGLRAQPRSGNLLTGQLYIAIDFMRNAPKTAFNGAARPLQIPTAAGTLDDVQEQVSSIVAKLDKIPFDSIGKRLDQALNGMDMTFNHLNTDILPEAGRTLTDVRKSVNDATNSLSGDSPLRQGIDQTLDELQRAARSLRAFSEYLSRHPESLIRGRRADPPPATSGDTHD
jgi:paraquat-inducible protein B